MTMTNYDWLKQMDEARRQREITAWYNNAKIRYILYEFWGWLQEEHTEEIKPCPFCGTDGYTMEKKGKWGVCCPHCDQASTAFAYENPYDAIRIWNMRAGDNND